MLKTKNSLDTKHLYNNERENMMKQLPPNKWKGIPKKKNTTYMLACAAV